MCQCGDGKDACRRTKFKELSGIYCGSNWSLKLKGKVNVM
jgi:hypothetical protein